MDSDKCPDCGSDNIMRERCPNGKTTCRDCGLTLPHPKWEERGADDAR